MANIRKTKPIVERADVLVGPTGRSGKNVLQGWRLAFDRCDEAVLQVSPTGAVIQPTHPGHIDLCQEVRAYPHRRYRLDVRAEPFGGRGGKRLIARLQACFVAFKAGREIRRHDGPAMDVRVGEAPIHRAYFQCPEGTGRLRICLRIHVHQPVVLGRVRLVETGEYLPQAHPLALPPEPWRVPPPCLPDRVLLCDDRTDDRGLLSWLREVFGRPGVRRGAVSALRSVAAANQLSDAASGADDVGCAAHRSRSGRKRLQGEDRGRESLVIDLPPAKAPTLDDLVTWSDRTIVVASLQTFVGAALRSGIQGICLQERVCGVDMPAGEVVLADYHTRGFALADDIPYCWNDPQDDFAHRYLVLPKPAAAKLASLGIHPSLVTETGHAQDRHQWLVLYRRGTSGALIVMDPAGLEEPSAGEDVPRIFDLLWRSALARDTVTLGQFATPGLHYQGVVTDILEAAKNYDMIEDLSPAVRMQGRGNPPPTWLWPSRRVDCLSGRKTLLLRTGFSHEDWPAVYGLTFWLKRLALASRVDDPLAGVLQKRLRILACPIAQPAGWRGCPEGVTAPPVDLSADDLAGWIDLAQGQERHIVILVPDKIRARTIQRSLSVAWSHPTEIVVALRAFDDVPSAGREDRRLVCKVLLPGARLPSHAASAPVIDLAACLLERLVYGTLGFLLPNRHWRPISLTRAELPPVGKVLMTNGVGTMQPVGRLGGDLCLPPGATLLGLDR